MDASGKPPLFVVMTASASMPGRPKGIYRKIALVETDEETWPKMISDRARGLVRIVHSYGAKHVGKTERSAYHRTLADAERYAAQLNRSRRPLSTLARELGARELA